MKFGRRFDKAQIPEWKDFYVSYRTLKKLLSPFKIVKKLYFHSPIEKDSIYIHNFSKEDLQKMEHFISAFEKVILKDLEKVLVFYSTKLSQTIEKWRKLRLNVMIYKKRQPTLKKDAKEEQFSMLQDSFQVLIKEIKLLTDYINVNLEAFQKIVKKQHKTVAVYFPNADLKPRFEKLLFETKAFKMRDRLNNFLYSVEHEYMDMFHKNRNEGVKELRHIFQGNLISRNETFWFGLYFGFSALLIIVIALINWNEGLDIDENSLYKEIFPIFRGMALIILYTWLLAWNVYGWTSYNVNYKLIFRFNHHYSHLSQILKRASVFTTLLLVFLLWHLLLEGQRSRLTDAIDFIPAEILPGLVWVGFLIYLFFPHKRLFNGQGRIYMFRLIKDILKTPFVPVVFTIIWATDQLTSFVLPLKDMEYTICFYKAYFFENEADLLNCQNPKRWTKSVIMAILPLLLRALQCIRQAFDARGKGSRRDPLLNLGKYSTSLVVAALSYLTTVYKGTSHILGLWIAFAAISTIYSYSWDIKKDWGFLEPNAKYRFLRNHLSYNKPLLYYIAIFANLIMRLAWTFSISPDVIAEIMRPELFSLIVGFVEILRRAVWNFLRVEKEHLANVGNFKVVPDMKLPYGNIVFTDNIEEELFNQDLQKILESKGSKKTPISNANYVPYVHHMWRSLNKSSDFEEENLKTDISENEELFRFRELSEKTLNPMVLIKDNSKDDAMRDLLKYRENSYQYKIWAKEISSFKQMMLKRANKFEVFAEGRESQAAPKRSPFASSLSHLDDANYLQIKSNRDLHVIHNEDSYENPETSNIKGDVMTIEVHGCPNPAEQMRNLPLEQNEFLKPPFENGRLGLMKHQSSLLSLKEGKKSSTDAESSSPLKDIQLSIPRVESASQVRYPGNQNGIASLSLNMAQRDSSFVNVERKAESFRYKNVHDEETAKMMSSTTGLLFDGNTMDGQPGSTPKEKRRTSKVVPVDDEKRINPLIEITDLAESQHMPSPFVVINVNNVSNGAKDNNISIDVDGRKTSIDKTGINEKKDLVTLSSSP